MSALLTIGLCPQIVRLSVCSQLVRLDLSNNKLTSLEGVSQNTTLKWLAAPGNQISSLQGLDALNELQVLNCVCCACRTGFLHTARQYNVAPSCYCHV